MRGMGMSVGTSQAPSSMPHTCRNTVSLSSSFIGTPASCLRHASLCGTRIQSSALQQQRKGCRRTTVMAAKGGHTERLHKLHHLFV